MSNNELPMLPPWLSESEGAESGYEAPVQNLPQRDLISEKPSKRPRFGRKAESERPDPGLKGRNKKKGKSKSDDAPEQRPWGEPQSESQTWGEPQQSAQSQGVRPNETAAPADPRQFSPNAQRPNGEFHQPANPQSMGGFPKPDNGFEPGPRPNTGPQQTGQGFPGPDQRGPGPMPQGEFVQPQQDQPQPPGPMPPQQLPPPQSGPMPQVPPAQPDGPSPNRPPIPDAPQAYSTPATPESGDAGDMTVRVGGRPDLPPPPQQTPQRPPLPEPPGQHEGQPAADDSSAPAWVTGLDSPAPHEDTGAPGPDAEAPQRLPDSPAPQPNTPAPEALAQPPAAPERGIDPNSGRHQAYDAPAPTHPGPESDRTVVAGRPDEQHPQAPYPPAAQGFSGDRPPSGDYRQVPPPDAPNFAAQQPPIAPQNEQYSPQAPGPAQSDPRFGAPAQPPMQGNQWNAPAPRQGGQGYPQQYQQGRYQQQPPQYQQQQYPPGQQPSLDNVPVRRAKKAPGTGWRRTVHHISGGAINPGMSAEERRLQELVARIRQPVRGDYRIAVLSLKGGVGKTTTTMGIGSIFSSIRGDRVIAVDANPDFGTLSQRVQLQTRSTVRDLLLDPSINSYSDVRRHTSQGTSRLEVLASERDPAASESFSEDEYRKVARILQRFYNIILTDCGTGLMHSAMAGVLELAHSLVLISSSAIDGARSAAATLDWLSLHGHDHLVRNAVVVINLPRPGSPNVGIQQLREYFLSRCRAVHIIPYDAHLSEGAEIELARLHKTTKRALVELAATVADDFATEHHRFSY
uniref:MinD/ParA family ATP-binding protein n=1 Tax=Nocardia jiangxiensis TaxID=282685 RepID=UPI00031DD507